MNARTRVLKFALFSVLTFLLSWGLDHIIISIAGMNAYKGLGHLTPGMMVPALVAIILQVFIFKDHIIHFRKCYSHINWIFYGFLILFTVILLLVLLTTKMKDYRIIFPGLGSVFITMWTLSVFLIRGLSSSEKFKSAGLKVCGPGQAIPFIAGVVAFFILQAVLNIITGLGEPVPRQADIYNIPVNPTFYFPVLILLFITVAVIGGPLSSLALYFGEEFGWRGFLQSLIPKKMKLPGSVLIGLVWGLWHIPLILRGMHTYPPTLTGISLALVFFMLWGIIQSYAVIKTGSIWLAVFLHGTVNYVYGFTITYIAKPHNNMSAFGMGWPGLIILLIIVIAISRDPAWKTE